MFNGRLQPQRTLLAVSVLCLGVVTLGLAAGAEQAAQTPATTPPSTNKGQTQTPSRSPRVIPHQAPLRASGKPSRKAPAKAVGAESPRSTKTVETQTPSRAPKAAPYRTPVRASGQSSREAQAEAAGAELPPTTTSMLSTAAGRRDPFKPTTPGPGGHSAAGGASRALPAGTRGLVISELRVEGIVRQESTNNMIAVVTNYTKRAYFLRVNDTVYNGVVTKITPEAVYFKENALDSSGRVATHEVAIKLGPAPGERR